MHQSPPSRPIPGIGLTSPPRPPARDRSPQEPHLSPFPTLLAQKWQQTRQMPVPHLATKPPNPPPVRRSPRHFFTQLHQLTSNEPHPSNDRKLLEPEPRLHLASTTHPLGAPHTSPHLLPHASTPPRLSRRDPVSGSELARPQYSSRVHLGVILHDPSHIPRPSAANVGTGQRGSTTRRVQDHGKLHFPGYHEWGIATVEASDGPQALGMVGDSSGLRRCGGSE